MTEFPLLHVCAQFYCKTIILYYTQQLHMQAVKLKMPITVAEVEATWKVVSPF